MNQLRTLCAVGVLALVPAARAQNAAVAAPPPVPATTSAAPTGQVANGTPVDLELVDALSSRVQKRGDTFRLKLSTALVVDGKEVLPAGVQGMGEIIDAAPAGGGGAPGKMLIAARYLIWNEHIPLRGSRLGGAGHDHTQTALAVGFAAGPFAMFIHGGNIELPVGTHIQAKLAADTTVTPMESGGTMPTDAPPPVPAGVTAAGNLPVEPGTSSPTTSTTTDHHQE